MLKELLLVGTGGFVGSILRYAVGRALGGITWLSLPWGTLAVNVAGCFLIGILSGLPTPLSAHARLVLITGLCGGLWGLGGRLYIYAWAVYRARA